MLSKKSYLLFPFLLFVASAYAEDKNSHELKSVVVTAKPEGNSLLHSSTVASVVDEDTLNQNMESTLGESIGFEPGVNSTFFGQGASRPVIRGFSGGRVSILENGLRTGDVSDISEDHPVAFDPLATNKIEILRGSKTILYGSSAIGGVVNSIDESIAEEPLAKPFEFDYIARFGNSTDNEKTVGLKTKVRTDNVNWFLSGFSRTTDSFEIPGFAETEDAREAHEHEEEEHDDDHDEHEEDGHERRKFLDNSDTETFGAKFGSSYTYDKGFVGISASIFDSDYGVPGHAHVEAHGDEEHDEDNDDADEHLHGEDGVRIESRRNRYAVRGQHEVSDSSVKTVKYRFAYTDYEHNEIEEGMLATRFERDTFEFRSDFTHNQIANFEGLFGFQFVYDDTNIGGSEAFTSPFKSYSPGIYFFEAYPFLDNFNFEVGGRVEYLNYDPSMGGTQDFVPFSGSVGVSYANPGYDAALTFSYTERAPLGTELFSDGAHLARQIYEIGNSSIDNEASFGVELVLRKKTGLVTGSFTPFYQNFSNYINLGATGDEMSGLPVFAYNEVDATISGFELTSNLHLDELLNLTTDHFHLGYQMDYVRAFNDSENRDLPRIPPLRQILSANYSYGDTLESNVSFVFAESQNNVGFLENPTSSYQILNANVSLKLCDGLKLFVRGTNLTDEDIRQHASFIKDTVPLRGRAVFFGVTGTI